MTKINKKANFWTRLLATTIDLLIFFSFLITSTFLVFDFKNANFFNKWTYYVWLPLSILFICYIWIIIPIVFSGQTIGMFFCKIKILPQDNKTKLSKAIFNRQRIFALVWMIVFLLFMIMVSPDLFLKAASIRQNKSFSLVEKFCLSIPSTLASIAIFTQTFLIITNAKSTRIGLNDNLSDTFTVWINKYELLGENEVNTRKILPKKRVLPTIKFEN